MKQFAFLKLIKMAAIAVISAFFLLGCAEDPLNANYSGGSGGGDSNSSSSGNGGGSSSSISSISSSSSLIATLENAQLLIPGQIASGSINQQNALNIYKVILAQPGELSVSITSNGSSTALPNNGADVQWLNADSTSINGSNGGFSFPYNESMELEAGTYYLEIIGLDGIGNTGTYNIRLDYFTNEIESNITLETAQLLVPGLTVSGSITSQKNIGVYKYELTEPGRFTMNVTRGSVGGLQDAYVRLLSADGTQMKRDNSYINPYNFSIDLEIGIYYMEITPYGSNTGTYNLRGDFTDAENNEIEPNDTRQTAQLLTSGQTVKGFISYQDNIDMYRIVLARSSKLTVNITRGNVSGLQDAYVRWLSADGTQMKRDNSYINPYNTSMDLEAGTYYIEITPYGSNTGTYNLTI
jgi:hypothetical protein